MTSLAESSGLLTADIGSLLVLAGACTVLVFPALGAVLRSTRAPSETSLDETR
ncbi:hypothetical protein IOD13_14150 [Brevibacterium casei]|nr:hypothetical protein [Brevibacterium casei]